MRMPVLGAALLATILGLTSAVAQEAKHGGRMVLTYKDDISTLDPAIGYDWQNPSMMKAIFDGLMDYRPGTFELVPDLAESYTVSDGGKTYTFKLRHGVKFHNGRELTARMSVIRSSAFSVRPRRARLRLLQRHRRLGRVRGGRRPCLGNFGTGSYTVSITLKQAKATFLNVLAMHFGSVVPKEEVDKYGADFGHHPVGTGAFKLVEWTPRTAARLPAQSRLLQARPAASRRGAVEVGQDPSVPLLRVKKGEVDLTGDGIPPAQFQSAMSDPSLKNQVIAGKQLQTSYSRINTQVPPLDDVRVRRAINMAINKDRIVRIINNRAAPASQPLPPRMPGYDPNYKGYPYDPEGAKNC